jgi:polar amino acid transport system substrate-binding protein
MISLVAIFIVALVAACSSAATQAPVTQAPVTQAPVTQAPVTQAPATPTPAPTLVATVPQSELIFQGKLVICDDMPVPPYSQFDAQGTPSGIDPDMGTEIAKRLGLQAVILNVVFNTIIPAVDSGKCDIIMSAMNINPTRQKAIFQIPYAQEGGAWVVAKGNPANILKDTDLCGKKVAVQTGTTHTDEVLGIGYKLGSGYDQICQKAGLPVINLQQYAKDQDAFLALISGQVQANLDDSATAAVNVAAHSDVVELSVLAPVGQEPQGIGVALNHPNLKAAVEKVLQSMVADGTYKQFFVKYGYTAGALLAP